MKVRKRWLFAAACLLAASLLLGGNANARAATSGELQEQIDRLEEQKADNDARLAQLREQLTGNLDEIQAVVVQKSVIDQEVSLLYGQIDTINDMIAAYSLLIADQQTELERAQARLAELNEKHKERIRAMEEGGTLSYWSVLFEANSFSDFLDRMNMIQEIAEADQRRLEEIRQAAAQVEQARQELADKKTELEATRAELQSTQADLEAKREEADRLLADLLARGEEFQLLIEESEDRQSELANEIAQRQDEYDMARFREWLATSEPPTTAPPVSKPETKPTEAPTAPPVETTQPATAPEETQPTEPEKPEPTEPEPTVGETGWRSPLTKPSWIVSPYGMRLHPVENVWKMHHGVDLDGDLGDPIVAARSGVVTYTAYEEYGGGYYIFINHGDGYSSTYMHMTHYIVSPGDIVSAGQIVGYMGDTGLTTGVHLHFGIYYNGKSVNPADYVDFS